jgi:hypothetical protein
MSEECVRKHFATREKYQDAAALSNRKQRSCACKRIVIASNDFADLSKYSLGYYDAATFLGSLAAKQIAEDRASRRVAARARAG